MIGILYGAAGFAAALCLFLAGFIFGESVPKSRRAEVPERKETPVSEEEQRKQKELNEAMSRILSYSTEVAYNGK